MDPARPAPRAEDMPKAYTAQPARLTPDIAEVGQEAKVPEKPSPMRAWLWVLGILAALVVFAFPFGCAFSSTG